MANMLCSTHTHFISETTHSEVEMANQGYYVLHLSSEHVNQSGSLVWPYTWFQSYRTISTKL